MSKFIQIVFAICIVVFLYVIGYFVFNREVIDALRETKDIKRKIPIFEGIKNLKINKNEIYNTSDPSHPTYRKLDLAINQRAGAEFSYNFWIYKESSLTGNVNVGGTDKSLNTNNDLILFVKGSKNIFNFKNICNQSISNYLVKCPLVKFEQNLDVLTVEINNDENPNSVGEGSANTCNDPSVQFDSKNAHKISIKGFNASNYNKKWFMVTLVVQDTVPLDPLPGRNNIKAQIYINGVLQFDKYLESSLANILANQSTLIRQNKGNLYLAPEKSAASGSTMGTLLYENGDIQQLFMADLTYYNYALGKDEISALYQGSFNKKVAISISDSQSTRTQLDDIKNNISAPAGLDKTTAKNDLMAF